MKGNWAWCTKTFPWKLKIKVKINTLESAAYGALIVLWIGEVPDDEEDALGAVVGGGELPNLMVTVEEPRGTVNLGRLADDF